MLLILAAQPGSCTGAGTSPAFAVNLKGTLFFHLRTNIFPGNLFDI